jgi:hypothetical protein
VKVFYIFWVFIFLLCDWNLNLYLLNYFIQLLVLLAYDSKISNYTFAQ